MTPQIAAAGTVGTPPLSNGERQQWNAYIDYLQKRGMKGNAALDNRDTALGQKLFNEYKATNPNFTLTYDRVGDVQKDLQDYRNGLVQKYNANPAIVPGIKSADEIMPGLSPVDNWLGSKTSNWKYPTASFTTSDGNTINYGTNTGAYDAAIAQAKNRK